jgi:hypothetical protein
MHRDCSIFAALTVHNRHKLLFEINTVYLQIADFFYPKPANLIVSITTLSLACLISFFSPSKAYNNLFLFGQPFRGSI